MKKQLRARKLLQRIMRITLLQTILIGLTLTLGYAHDAHTQGLLDRAVSVKANKLELRKVLSRIEAEVDVKFVYSSTVIQPDRRVSVKAEQRKLSEVLAMVLEPLDISYRVIGGQIMLTTAPANQTTLTEIEKALLIVEKTVSGTVSGENGDALPGVSVVLKGAQRGTTTDAEGRFEVSVSETGSAVLVFSFVGYKTQEISVGAQSSIQVSMVTEDKALNEVVVVGYGTQRRKDLTGAVSIVNVAELESVPLINSAQALQGRAAGVTVTQATGRPGAPFVIQVRGVGTIGNTDPLFVIDGVIGAGGGNNINPNDIESIQVLKDASAAAIYGSRAANGVVVITTKRGKSGKPRISFDSYYGVQNVWKKLDVLNAQQYAEYSNEMQTNGGQPPIAALANPSSLRDVTNWQDEVFRAAPIKEYNLSLSGGNDNANFMISGNYYKQDGIVITNGFERYAFRANSDFKIGKRLKIGESMALAFTTDRNTDEAFALTQAVYMPTYLPVYDPNDATQFAGPNVVDGMDAKNPVRIMRLQDRRNRNFSLIGNVYADVSILPGLNYRFSLGLTYGIGTNYNYLPQYRAGERDINQFSTLSESANWGVSPLLENTLNYTKQFGKHELTVLGGYTRQWSNYRSLGANVRNFPTTTVRVLPFATELQSVSGGAGSWALTSLLGRFNYQYNDKYLLTASLRQDGSSRFAPGKRYGVYPSVSAGWRISGEEFLANSTVVNDLKLRVGWGQLGMQEVGDYPYQGGLFNTSRYVFGTAQAAVPAISQRELANNDISWETVTTTNVGLDASLLSNALTISLDYFTRQTNDILLQLPLPPSSGISVSPTVNGASVNNQGLELAVGLRRTMGDFTISLNANGSYLLKNEVTSLGDRTQPIFSSGSINRTLQGYNIAHFYGHRVDGIYQSQAEIDRVNENAVAKGATFYQTARTSPGDIRFKDINSDGVINGEDREVLGTSIPLFNYGANLTMGYRNFDFSMMFQGAGGNYIYNKDRALFTESMTRSFNTFTTVLDRWRPNNPSTTMPRAVAGDPNGNARFSDRWIEKGDYGRLKLVTLGYTLPGSVLSKLTKDSGSRLRVYLTGQNLLTFTKVSTWDPEFTGRNNFNNLDRGTAESIYPQARTFLIGLQATF